MELYSILYEYYLVWNSIDIIHVELCEKVLDSLDFKLYTLVKAVTLQVSRTIDNQ